VAVANFRVAVDRNYKSASGERETDFIDVVAWRQNAEFVNKYVTKGRLVFVEGTLQVRQWETPEGQRRRSSEVVAENIRPLDRPREREGGEAGGYANAGARSNQSAPPREEYAPPPAEPRDFGDVPDITDPFADQ
jgi:single-strand DNA-binding protein